jgi:hypothetical protein
VEVEEAQERCRVQAMSYLCHQIGHTAGMLAMKGSHLCGIPLHCFLRAMSGDRRGCYTSMTLSPAQPVLAWQCVILCAHVNKDMQSMFVCNWIK